MKMKLSFDSQFADGTTLFNADLASLERAQKIIDDFGRIAGLSLNVKKQRLFGWGNEQIIQINP